MKKSLSLLVAIALVFSMFSSMAFAADAALTTEQKYEALVKAGIFEGSDDGQAHLDKTMTRAQAAKIVSLLAGYKAGVVVKDAGYTDLSGAGWAKDYINFASEIGVLEGKGNNKFDPSANVTIQQLATIVVKLVKTAGVVLPAGEAVEGDVAEWAAADVAAVVKAGLIAKQADYTIGALRGLLVDVTYAAQAELANANKPAVSAKAVGAKKVEVTFNKAIDDAKATFAVKKGTMTVNVASKSFNKEKTVVTLETSSKLTDGEYTVSVGGIEEKALTASFKAQNEKVTEIKFKSTNAPMSELPTTAGAVVTLKIPYQVVNQYGENITKYTSLNSNIVSPSSVNPAKGTVDIVGPYRINDVVTVTLIHAETTTSVVQTFTVVAPARVAEVAISGLYNKDGKTLEDSTNLTTDQFYVLVDAKDQYANEITDAAALTKDLIINQTNSTIVNVDSAFTTVEIDGVNQTALKLNNPTSKTSAQIGQSNITLISNTSGKNANFNVVVAETVRADVINLVTPGDLYAGEDAYVPVEVYDKAGNAITNLTVLNDEVKGVKITAGGVQLTKPFVQKDDSIQIKIKQADVLALQNAGSISIIAQTASFKIATLTLTVKEKSIPKVIVGLKADYAKAFKTGSTNVELKHSNFIIEDQHGRVMPNDSVKAWFALQAGNKIVITEDNTNSTVTFAGAVPVAGTTTSTVDIATDAGVKFNAGSTNSSEKISFALYAAGVLIPSSQGEATLNATDGTQYVSYTVDSIGTVYDAFAANDNADANTEYSKTIKVNGVLANGSKVALNSSDFSVSALSNASVNAAITNDKINVVSKLSGYGDKTEFVAPVVVTINSTGKQYTQDVTFSKVAPKVASVKFVNAGAATDGDAQTSVSVVGSTYNVNSFVNDHVLKVVVTDQYGVKTQADLFTGKVEFADGTEITAVTFTVVPAVGDITIANNGKYNASVSGFDANEEFDVIVAYAGGASATLRVKH